MLTSKQQETEQDNRLEANDFLSYDEAIDGVVAALAGKGLNGKVGEPDVFTIIKHNGKNDRFGNKLLDVIIHIGSPKQDILNDVNTLLP